MSSPWDIKHQIEVAHRMADEYGFELRDWRGLSTQAGAIYLFAKPDNPVFTKDAVLDHFNSWSECLIYFRGYEKADMAWRIGGKKE